LRLDGSGGGHLTWNIVVDGDCGKPGPSVSLDEARQEMPLVNAPKRRKFRLNVRAALVLGIGLAAAVVGFAVLSYVRSQWKQPALLTQALQQAGQTPPNYNLALVYLNEYLASHPDDTEALESKAKVLAEIASNGDQLTEAIKLAETAVRLDPDSPRSQKLRKLIVEMDLRMGRFKPLENLRMHTAETTVREMIAKGDNSPEALRLLGQVLEVQAFLGDRKATDAAAQAYESARKLEPLNTEGAEMLAQLYQDPQRLNRPADAEKVLDEMLQANQNAERQAKTPEARRDAKRNLALAHLARYRYFSRNATQSKSLEGRQTMLARAAEELRDALANNPEDFNILLTAAESELQRGDVAKARVYFDRIPTGPDQKRDAGDLMQMRIVQGMIDLAENRPDEAIESWQEGLVAAGGTSADLTLRLAQIQLLLGRVDEAEPLIQQHRRLVGGTEPPPVHRYLEGMKLYHQNQPRKAIEVLAKALPQVGAELEPRLRYLLGQCYEKVQDPSAALEQYARASTVDPKWSTPRLARAMLLQRTRPLDAQQEVALAETELRNDPTTIAAGARLALQRELAKPQEERSWDDVNQRIERLKAVSPGAPDVALIQADVLLNTQKIPEAAALLEQAARHDKRKAELWIGWATVLTRLNQPQDALRVLEQAAAPDAAGDTAALRIARARLLTQIGNGKEAREVLIRGEKDLKPMDRPLVWAELGAMLQQRHETDEARKAFQKYAELLPDDPRPRLNLINLALAAGDRDAALKAMDALKAITGPNGLYYRVAVAQDLLRETPEGQAEAPDARKARYAQAEKLIDQIEEVAPREPFAYVLRGQLHERRDEPAEAIAAYERALQHGGGETAIARLVSLYTAEGRFADLKAMRDSQAVNAGAVTKLGALEAFRQGNKEAAEELAQQLVAGNPESLDVRVWQARMLNALGKPADAEKTLRELVNQQPEQVGPWVALLFFQVGQKQNDAALQTIEQMKHKIKFQKDDLPEFLYAQCYRAAGATAQADAMYARSLEKWPTNPNVVHAVAERETATNHPEKAEKILRDYIAKAPEGRWAVRNLATLLAEHPKDSSSWQQAWDLVKDAPAGGDAAEDRLTRAMVLLRHPEKSAKYGEVETILTGLLDDVPADRPVAVAARDLLKNLYFAQGKKDQARALAAVSAADTSNPLALALYIENLIRDEKLDAAAAQLKRLAALAPDDVRTLMLRASLLEAQKKHGEAVAILEQAFDRYAGSAGGEDACRNIVAIFGALDGPPMIDDLKTGVRLAEKLVARDPGASWILARLLQRQGKTPDAKVLDLCKTAVAAGTGIDLLWAAKIAIGIAAQPNAGDDVKARADEILAVAAKREPTNLDIQLIIGNLRYTQGRYEESVKAYRDAWNARPSNPDFLNNLAWTLSENLNRPQEALEVINELFSRIPAQPEYIDTRASIYARLGRDSEAIDDWKKAAAARPDDASYAYRLARAYLKAGDEANFRVWIAAAKKNHISPDDLQPNERDELKTLLSR
jgi:tetratricopeptide (TPR) repeat protein